jgi:hypothetical protein
VNDPPRLPVPTDLTVLALLVAACSFLTATALAAGTTTLARLSLVAAGGAAGGVAARLVARSHRGRERAAVRFAVVTAVAGVGLFGARGLLGTATDPVAAGLPVRALGTLSLGTLVVATLATTAYVVGLLGRREPPDARADRIARQVVGRDSP